MGKADQKIIEERYQVFPRTLCFITHDDDILLLRGASDKHIWPDQYNGVGGHVKPNEDIRAAALREIREETGLEVQDLRLRGVINIPVDVQDRGVLLFVFTAIAATKKVRSSKEGTPTWVARDQVTDFELVEDLPIILPRVMEMDPDTPPFFALYTYDQDDQLIIHFAAERNKKLPQ